MIKPSSTVLVLCSLLIDIGFAFLFRYQVVMYNSPKGGLIYQFFTWRWVEMVEYIHMFFVASSVFWAIAVLRRNSASALLLGLIVKGLLLVVPVLSGRVMMGE